MVQIITCTVGAVWKIYQIFPGTNEVVNVKLKKNARGEIEVATYYCGNSDAITENGAVDFTRSALLALDRNTSLNHTLPTDLYPGHYRVYVYDIERDGTLHNGVRYPAVIPKEVFVTRDNFHGMNDFIYTYLQVPATQWHIYGGPEGSLRQLPWHYVATAAADTGPTRHCGPAAAADVALGQR